MVRIILIGVLSCMIWFLTGCGGASDIKPDATMPLTKEMLKGKIFYGIGTYIGEDGNTSKYYGESKYVFPEVLKIKMKECPCSEEHKWLIDSYKQPVSIEHGKLKITTKHHGVIYVALQKIEGSTWDVFCEKDQDGDGVIDRNATGIWFTAEPENFPRFPDFSNDMDGEELVDLAQYSLFTCGL